MSYSIHPIAELFPLVEGEEFERLVADVKANGLLDPIAIQGNVILDGRNRLRACEAASVTPHYKEVPPGTDALKYITSKNVHRRHLSTAQRADIAARMANLSVDDTRSNLKRGNVPGGSNDPPASVTIEEAAAAMNVSPKSVKRAKAKQRKASGAATKPAAPAKAAPATLPWTTAVEQHLGDLRGVSRDDLTREKAGRAKWRPDIEAILGYKIPTRLEVGSMQVQQVADAFLKVLAERRPESIAEAKAAAEAARESLPQSAQQKLDAAIRAATRALEAEFEGRVRDRVTQLLNESVLPMYNEQHDRHVAFNDAYQGVMKRDEYKRLLQFLHPDRHSPELQTKAAQLFDLIRTKEELLCGAKSNGNGTSSLPKTVDELMARRRKK